ncbi:MAG: serine hydrolase [Lunatimonas sp.]|uniref:serine hydrolase n=1 Tax=Lunatimonas sp. TaxID=2060141 RepID=UPI00263AF412|nr:serine hydrolase [Lunatimonas sp.]MCC5939294.1 serine hydrolase [Lunatimonas sp.]
MRSFHFAFVLLFTLVILPFVSQSQTLQAILEKELTTFRGTAGLYALNLKTGEEIAINADTLFPTASIIKVPILVGVFDKIEQGELSYTQPLLYRDSLKYGGSGLMQFFRDSTETDLSVLVSLMITYSDNTTSLWCQALAGGGTAINALMENLGLVHTRVNSRTPGREANREQYGWGQTTPQEMAQLLVKIRNGDVVSPKASERMYRLMTNIYYDENALSQIPPYIQTASKQGMVNASRSELIMVNAPSGDYVFYIATKDNEDQRWEENNESYVLKRTVSKLLWEAWQ